jgi:hypothetical protein
MSNVPPAPPPAAPPAPRAPERNEVTIVGHSNLFYWWPVWAVGFLMAILTRIDNQYLVTVPNHSRLARTTSVTYLDQGKGSDGTVQEGQTFTVPDTKKPEQEGRDIVILPDKKRFDPKRYPDLDKHTHEVKLHISPHRSYGVIFAIVLLVVVVLTNVPLRGMWSVLVIVGTVTIILILNLAGVWDKIVQTFTLLDIRINMGGYLFISTVLLILWAITVFLFDKQVYLTFSPGQMRVCTEIGGGEKVYDATGMAVEKQKSDFFRHKILGLGSGDIVVRTTGAQAHQFELHNVLWVNHKIRLIEKMMQRKILEQQR